MISCQPSAFSKKTAYCLRLTAYCFKRFCGARTDLNIFLSNKSPPVGLIVAVTVLPPSVYVNLYSPLDCFSGFPASKNLNKPHVPGLSIDDAPDEFVFDCKNRLVVFELPELETFPLEVFAEVFGVVPEVVLVSAVEANFINAPVSPDGAGNLKFVEPVPFESIFCPSIVTSITAISTFCKRNS